LFNYQLHQRINQLLSFAAERMVNLMAIISKEQVLLVNSDSIPDELKRIDAWVLWCAVWDEERQCFNKVPYQTNGKKATSTHPNTWASFESVMGCYDHGNYEGIGFVLSAENGYSCVDIDNIESVDDLPELAQEIVNLSYAELSPSGNGVHVWIKGFSHDKTLYMNKNTALGYEIYSESRFITFTGEVINDFPINESMEIQRFIDKVFRRKEQQTPVTHMVAGKSALTEGEIIRMAKSNAKGGKTFSALMEGSWHSLYNNNYSGADMALLNILAFWSNRDPVMMDRIYRKSSLMREKFDRPQNFSTYGQETIWKAINECQNTFSPPSNETESDKPSWWKVNQNGTKSFLHQVLAKEVAKQYHVVRYPNAHSDVYFFNQFRGIYEPDRSGRQLSGIIRKLDDELKSSQVREVQMYLYDTCPVVNKLNEDYIAVKNGLINFKTFELEPFDPKKFVIQRVATKYNPDAYDTFVASTLSKVADGHQPTIENIKELFGCILYPGIIVGKIFYLLGRSSANGKSSILNMIHQTFNKDGHNISAVTPQKLANSTFAGSSIYMKLANVVDDLPETVIEDSGLLKTLTTGGFAEIERKGRDSETVRLSATMVIASNHFPNMRETGNAINRRLHIIPFSHNFITDPERLSDEETDKLISKESASEYVLKLAIDSLKKMLTSRDAEKLTPNPRSVDAIKSFSDYNDPLADFFHEFDEKYLNEVRGTRAIQDYTNWCRDNKVDQYPTKKFKEIVCEKFDMEYKDKKIMESGVSKTVKGFKSKSF